MAKQQTKSLIQYLQRYAEPEVQQLQALYAHLKQSQLRFAQAVVIPAYLEQADFIYQWQQDTLSSSNSLIIVVVNQPDNNSNTAPQQNLFAQLKNKLTLQYENAFCCFGQLVQSNNYLLLIDRFNQPIPSKQGVGLARKIGADIALSCYQKHFLQSAWLASTDADAILPSDYCAPLQENTMTNTSALIYGFYHASDDIQLHQATQLYEQAMRYYVAGLKYAGSTYAFYTLGSILAINLEHYCHVRGFPKKNAAEDFYLLNKLAKVGAVKSVSPCIRLQARLSNRVPFGTGPAVADIINLQRQGKDYAYYHPVVFEQLKTLLQAFDSLWINRNDFTAWRESLSKPIQVAVDFIQLATFCQQHQNTNQQQFEKQLISWFDAFKTLKIIHFWRDNFYTNIELKNALQLAPFTL